MRPIFYCQLAGFLLAFLVVSGQVQSIGGPEEPETPGGGGEELPVPCITCCVLVPVDPACTEHCGCKTPSLCPSFIGLQSPSVHVESISKIYRSFADMRTKMTDTTRGKALLSAWETHAERVADIYRKHPAIALRVGKALVEYWPTDIWAGDSNVVERDALLELRTIFQQIARADAQSDGNDLAGIIHRQILPRLDDSLIGRSPADAFQCFISDSGC